MGQPITLVKGNERLTVYGRSQAAVHLAEGWRLAEPIAGLPQPPPVNATETAIQLAEARGLDLSTVVGTGAGGRILVKDVREATRSKG